MTITEFKEVETDGDIGYIQTNMYHLPQGSDIAVAMTNIAIQAAKSIHKGTIALIHGAVIQQVLLPHEIKEMECMAIFFLHNGEAFLSAVAPKQLAWKIDTLLDDIQYNSQTTEIYVYAETSNKRFYPVGKAITNRKPVEDLLAEACVNLRNTQKWAVSTRKLPYINSEEELAPTTIIAHTDTSGSITVDKASYDIYPLDIEARAEEMISIT